MKRIARITPAAASVATGFNGFVEHTPQGQGGSWPRHRQSASKSVDSPATSTTPSPSCEVPMTNDLRAIVHAPVLMASPLEQYRAQPARRALHEGLVLASI